MTETINNVARNKIAYLEGELIGIKGDIAETKKDLKDIKNNELVHLSKRIDKVMTGIIALAGGLVLSLILLVVNLVIK